MKPHIAALYALVSLCLVFSLTALLIVANDHGAFTPITRPTYPTNPPASPPTGTPTQHPYTTTPPTANTPEATPSGGTKLTYKQTSLEDHDGTGTVTFTITAQYHNGPTATFGCSDFYLQTYLPRMMYYFSEAAMHPQETGTYTVGPTNPTASFQLTFEFPTRNFNGMDEVNTQYQIHYSGTAAPDWQDSYRDLYT